MNTFNTIDLIKVQVGHEYLIEIDPYWNDPAEVWPGYGDGGSYGGVVETLHRNVGESTAAFRARAKERISEIYRQCED